MSFDKTDKELNRLYNKIRSVYSNNPEFLEKLHSSQLAWIKLRDADLKIFYPKENKQVEYGSVYPMCVSAVTTKITLERITFLKQWIRGTEEGEVCSGSIKNTWQLKNEK